MSQMVTRDEVPHDKRLSGSITVTVDEVRTNPKPRRDSELSVCDDDIPVLVTGPTAPISSYDTNSTPSTWLLVVSDAEIKIKRQPV